MAGIVHGPRVLLQGDRYRFVAVPKEDEHGVPYTQHVVEFLDGYDAMGDARWIDANKRDALSTYAGAMNWLKGEFAKRLLGEE